MESYSTFILIGCPCFSYFPYAFWNSLSKNANEYSGYDPMSNLEEKWPLGWLISPLLSLNALATLLTVCPSTRESKFTYFLFFNPGKHPFPSYFLALLPTESEEESKAGDERERPLAGREGLVYQSWHLWMTLWGKPGVFPSCWERKA